MTTLQKVRAIKEGDRLMIGATEYVCNMASGFANSDNVNFRFMNPKLPKKIRHSQENEYYYSCTNFAEDIETGKITVMLTSKAVQTSTQLTLFNL